MQCLVMIVSNMTKNRNKTFGFPPMSFHFGLYLHWWLPRLGLLVTFYTGFCINNIINWYYERLVFFFQFLILSFACNSLRKTVAISQDKKIWTNIFNNCIPELDCLQSF